MASLAVLGVSKCHLYLQKDKQTLYKFSSQLTALQTWLASALSVQTRRFSHGRVRKKPELFTISSLPIPVRCSLATATGLAVVPPPLLSPGTDVQVEKSTQHCLMLIKNQCSKFAEALNYLFMLPLPKLKFIVSLERETGQVHRRKEVSASTSASESC